MKRISHKMIYEFLVDRFDLKTEHPGDFPLPALPHWSSRIDGSYFCHAKMAYEKVSNLIRLGVTDQLQNAHNDPNNIVNIGFNPESQEWLGWSHRAMWGFAIGSECKKGMVHYRPENEAAFLLDTTQGWNNPYHTSLQGKIGEKPSGVKGVKGVWISWIYNNEVPNKSLRGKLNSTFRPFPEKFGKGEWTAKTLEDAKQMAIDFADNVG